MRRIRIGTRSSRLALAQTELVKRKIEKAGRDIFVELVPIVTKGDRLLDRPLDRLGGKGAFTKELEEQLLEGKIDLAVHSAKDLPMELPEGLCIGAVTERANPVDVLVTRCGIKLSDFKVGAVIGTGSLRRELQLKEINPGVEVRLVRGNIETRLRKLEEGLYDGIVLAAAGLSRLHLELDQQYQWEYLSTEDFLPAAGQGILAVECRRGDMEDICREIHSEKAGLMLAAEREFLRGIGGSCNAPAAALCEKDGDFLRMQAAFWEKNSHGYEKHMTREEILLPPLENGQEEDPDAAARIRKDMARELGKRAANAVCGRTGEVVCGHPEEIYAPGMVSLTGAGPGNRELLTLGALERIRRADVIVYDHLIPVEALNEAKPGAELIYAGKKASRHHMKQEDINRLLIEKAREGKQVVRLKGGDPLVFGRGAEEARACAGEGIPFEFIPGVSSAYSVPEYAGIPVTERHMASSFHVITGQEGSHKEALVLDYEVLAREEGTLVFLMGLKRVREITESLMACGKDRATPAAVISRGSSAAQKCVRGCLKDIAENTESAGLSTPAVLVVGQTAEMSGFLSWYGKGPLAGKRILLTGTKDLSDKLSGKLRDLGMEAVPFSLISVKEKESAEKEEVYRNLEDYSWAVFTSGNGVREFFRQLSARKIDVRRLAGLKFAVVGRGTGQALEEQGIYPDFVPSEYTTACLAAELAEQMKPSENAVLLRADGGSKDLPDILRERGMSCTDLGIYTIEADERKKEELLRQLLDTDYILFASPSAVRAAASWTEASFPETVKILCIGPVTEAEAKRCGFSVYRTAKEYSADGIVSLLLSEGGI